jgi:hypothetical protein
MHRGALGPDGYGFLIQDDDAAAHADEMLAKTIFLIGMDGETQ